MCYCSGNGDYLLQIMTSYIMYDILKPSVFWKIWRRRAPYFIFFFGGGAGFEWP